MSASSAPVARQFFLKLESRERGAGLGADGTIQRAGGNAVLSQGKLGFEDGLDRARKRIGGRQGRRGRGGNRDGFPGGIGLGGGGERLGF